jgi:hypothetical protein
MIGVGSSEFGLRVQCQLFNSDPKLQTRYTVSLGIVGQERQIVARLTRSWADARIAYL